MKKHLRLTLISMFATGVLFGQYNEVLTTSSVIEMTKAHLTEEVMRNLIMFSPVDFNLEDSALIFLRDEGVPEAVIETMISAHNLNKIYQRHFEKRDMVDSTWCNETRPEVYNTELTSYNKSVDNEIINVYSLNFVTPLTELIKYGEGAFMTFENAMAEWDKTVRIQTGDVYRIKEQILQTELTLRELKNSNIEIFGPEINKTKIKLGIYRENYIMSKEKLKDIGVQIQKWLKTEMNDRVGIIDRRFNSVAKLINASESDPALGEKSFEMTARIKGVTESTSSYLIYATEILVWYQNWIREIDSLIIEWNPRISSITKEDEQLRAQLVPIEEKIDMLAVNSRKNRKELSGLKKQISTIEKDRKELLKKMNGEKKVLATILKEMNNTSKISLKQRFDDAIDNVGFTFDNKLGI